MYHHDHPLPIFLHHPKSTTNGPALECPRNCPQHLPTLLASTSLATHALASLTICSFQAQQAAQSRPTPSTLPRRFRHAPQTTLEALIPPSPARKSTTSSRSFFSWSCCTLRPPPNVADPPLMNPSARSDTSTSSPWLRLRYVTPFHAPAQSGPRYLTSLAQSSLRRWRPVVSWRCCASAGSQVPLPVRSRERRQ